MCHRTKSYAKIIFYFTGQNSTVLHMKVMMIMTIVLKAKFTPLLLGIKGVGKTVFVFSNFTLVSMRTNYKAPHSCPA